MVRFLLPAREFPRPRHGQAFTQKADPPLLTGRKAWAAGFFLFIALFGLQAWNAGLLGPWGPASLSSFGLVFYRMCLVSSAVAVPLALWKNHRSWCAVCPVGNILRH